MTVTEQTRMEQAKIEQVKIEQIGTEQTGTSRARISASQAWLRALELTASINRSPFRTLSSVMEEAAPIRGEAPALLSDHESFSYATLTGRANQYARWALDQGLGKGDVVCLLMNNRPEYFAIWLGVTSVGVVVSLLNTNLIGPSLAHCIRIVSPKRVIVVAEFADRLTTATQHLEPPLPAIWIHGEDRANHSRIDLDIERYASKSLTENDRRATSIDDCALYIYTSGTTGLPKAAKVSHARVLQWSYWFAGMMDVQAEDRMYNCLPMYHSVGGVQVIGAMLVAGASVVVRERFSASQFWADIVHWDCTLLQYIGELCRYLLHMESSVAESRHRIRLACGNGLSPEIWEAFQERFRISQILEFYAATEGGVSLFNVLGKPGAIGHIPPYLSHRFAPALIAIDVETGQPLRDAHGFCIRCAVNQAGEALGKILDDPSSRGSRFEGYAAQDASEQKILHGVFERNDAWFRTGDLLRKDEKGYYYFVDRIGDTFRRKGENVATNEIAKAACEFSGIEHAAVYGVAVPGVEGRVGMAAVVVQGELDLAGFRRHLAACLPLYALPVFLRIRNQVDITGTFKYSKTELVRQGYDPGASHDRLYFDERGEFIALDEGLFHQIQRGEFRL